MESWVSEVQPSYFECSDKLNTLTSKYDLYSPLGTVFVNSNSVVLKDFAATYQLSEFGLPGVTIPIG